MDCADRYNDGRGCKAGGGSAEADAPIGPFWDASPSGQQANGAADGLANFGGDGIGCSLCKGGDGATVLPASGEEGRDSKIGDDLRGLPAAPRL
jgi:hypothetical protein